MGDKRVTRSNDRNEPVSLHGLDPETALRALLAVKPDDQPADERGLPDSVPSPSPGAKKEDEH
jgi:hypothetical protein